LGRLAQLAVNELNEEHHESYQFIAVRLPYDTQADEEDAQKSIDFIQPTHSVAVNVKPGADAFMPQRLRRYPMQTFFLLAKQSKTLSKEMLKRALAWLFNMKLRVWLTA
jgi:NAD synthase